MFKSALTILAALSLAPAASAAELLPIDHLGLYDALETVGVYRYLNPPEVCQKQDVDGIYTWNERGESALVICQDNATSEAEVEWTENDLDTLRHESWHVIQDCLHDERADSSLQPLVLTEQYSLMMINAAVDVLGQDQVAHIINTYRARGLDDDAVVLEIEAFLVAATTNASTITNKLINSCSINF